MPLRPYFSRLETDHKVIRIKHPISKTLAISGVLKQLEPDPVLFDTVEESDFNVIGNIFCSKSNFASYFGIPVSAIIATLLNAIDHPTPCQVVTSAPCQEVVDFSPDLDRLPILLHCDGDGGNYISSGVVIACHPKYGQNVDFHRAMQFSKTELAVRVVQNRHFDAFLEDLHAVDVAMVIGNPPNVLAAAATSVAIGVNELEIANTLEPLTVIKAKTVNVYVPAQAEFVLEGTIYLDRQHSEGPFVDLTETQDIERQQPVFVVKTITHRKDAIWHALLPGALEHKLLMGMPREPTIYKSVNQVVRCLDVNVNPGGCSWLHAIIQIDKQSEDDGRKAIQAAFQGHTSCKHVYVVDKDIDIYNPQEVEWAMATRFQGDRDLIMLERHPGSSLDPSAEADTHLTTRLGFDLTKPLSPKGKSFNKAAFPRVDLKNYLD